MLQAGDAAGGCDQLARFERAVADAELAQQLTDAEVSSLVAAVRQIETVAGCRR
jgi:hypothetical protein